MKRAANFFKSILPFLLVIVLQIVITLIMGVISVFTSDTTISDVMGGIFGSGTIAFPQLTNIIYGIVALILFGLWYRYVFILPFQNKKKSNYPRGFSFHTIMAILFLGIGLYYVTTLVVDAAAAIHPAWLENYNAIIQSEGFESPTFALILYSVILAPVVEELVFRGLTMRYARQAFPFWLANIWQALLFGVLHGNVMQGIYAFVMGLFLGFVAHRGRGIKYSIPLHILFNIIGIWFSGLIGLTLDLNYAIAMILGIALAIFAVWLFYTDFTPAVSKSSGQKREQK